LVSERVTEYRRKYLEIAQRRARPGSGSSLAFLLSRDWSEPAVDLRDLSTPFVIVGAVATWLYMPQRVTHDLDILIRAQDGPQAGLDLSAAGFILQGRLSIGGTSWKGPHGEVLDVIESNEEWVDDALTRPNRSPSGLPVVTLPFLVLLKLTAGRGQDLVDIQRMLGQADDAALDEVRTVVRRFRPADAEDLESLIALGKLEYQ